MAQRQVSAERRRRLTRRLVPAIGALAVVALILGIIVGAGESATERTARAYAAAWQRDNYSAMYSLLTPSARSRISLEAFVAGHRRAADTATAIRFEPGRAEEEGDSAIVPITISTRAFGTIRSTLEVPVRDERVDWRPEMVFPGLRTGEQLTRQTRAP